jgi:hypothetical protein
METFEDAQSSENIRGEDPIAGRHSQCICTMMWNTPLGLDKYPLGGSIVATLIRSGQGSGTPEMIKRDSEAAIAALESARESYISTRAAAEDNVVP